MLKKISDNLMASFVIKLEILFSFFSKLLIIKFFVKKKKMKLQIIDLYNSFRILLKFLNEILLLKKQFCSNEKINEGAFSTIIDIIIGNLD